MFLTGVILCSEFNAWTLPAGFHTPTPTGDNSRTPPFHPPTRPAQNKATSLFLLQVRLRLAVSERGDPSRFLFSFFFYLLLLLLLLFSSSPAELLCATLLADQLREKLCASLCLLMGDGVKLNKWAVRRWWQAADVVSLLSPPKTHTHAHTLVWRLCNVTFIRCCLTPVWIPVYIHPVHAEQNSREAATDVICSASFD